MTNCKLLIDKIIKGEFLSREDQISEYNEYQGGKYNSNTGAYEYPALPDNLIIFWSRYTYEDYQGDGDVWGYNTEKEMFFNVTGSHCSCYGLEGQWDEEYYTYDEMVAVLERILSVDYVYDQEKRAAQEALLKTIKGEEV